MKISNMFPIYAVAKILVQALKSARAREYGTTTLNNKV